MTLTITQLPAAIGAAVPNLSADLLAQWASALDGPMTQYAINTPHRIAGFLGQCSEESGGFSELEEDLNYSAAGAARVWPTRFPTAASATPYARNPEKLANHVYCSRMGNGDEASGDGWEFRGRGLIQTTGRDSYSRFSAAIGKPVDDAAAFMATIEGAAAAACWDWNDMGCSPFADSWDLTGLTKRINGGLTALADRTTICNRVLASLLGSVLMVGSKGAAVTTLQTALRKAGFYAGNLDGDFGEQTEDAVRQFETSRGLLVDGVAGHDVDQALGLAA